MITMHFEMKRCCTNNFVSYVGRGQVELQDTIASPHFRGQVIKSSRKPLISAIHPNNGSKGCITIHKPAKKNATGQATKNNNIIQSNEKHGLPIVLIYIKSKALCCVVRWCSLVAKKKLLLFFN